MSLKLELSRRSWNQTPWKGGLWLNLTLNLIVQIRNILTVAHHHSPAQILISQPSADSSEVLVNIMWIFTMSRWCQNYDHIEAKLVGKQVLRPRSHTLVWNCHRSSLQLCPSSTSPLCILTCGNNLELAYFHKCHLSLCLLQLHCQSLFSHSIRHSLALYPTPNITPKANTIRNTPL